MAEETVNTTVEISVSGTPLRVNFDMPAAKVKLRRMLPVFQQFSNTFVRMGVESIEESGKSISCRAGCGACCRQLVPIAEIEALELAEVVNRMPQERQAKVRERFAAAVKKLAEDGYFERLEAAAASGPDEFSSAVDEYFTFGIACPFLENESCSIHESRPIACREYLVTSPPEFCSSATGDGIANVKHFFHVKEAVIGLGGSGRSENLPFIPMIGALDWAASHPDITEERDSREWMGMFFEELKAYSGRS